MYPLKSSKKELEGAYARSIRKMKDAMGPRKYKKLQSIQRGTAAGSSSLKRHSSNGRLEPRRRRFHNQILKKQFRNRTSVDRRDPDLYIFGGLPASGKGIILRKKVPEKTTVIDNDYYKEQLAKKSKSPIKGYKLAHAQHLHEEAGVLVNRAIDKSIKQRRDVVYDGTMRNEEKAKRIIKKYKKAGYDVHYLATQKKPARAITHATNRFIESGRLVPPGFIKSQGNSISQNSWVAKKYADTHQIFDSNTRKTKLVSKSKYPMTKNFRDPKD